MRVASNYAIGVRSTTFYRSFGSEAGESVICVKTKKEPTSFCTPVWQTLDNAVIEACDRTGIWLSYLAVALIRLQAKLAYSSVQR